MAKEIEYTQICPICGGKKVGFYTDDKATEAAGIEMYNCARCKNIFAFPLEVPKKSVRRVKEVPLSNKILHDTPREAIIPVGLFEIGVYWKILGVVMTVFGIGYLFAASWPINCYTRTIGKICESTILPAHFSFLGLAILATGMFFILESYAVNHKYYNHSRLMKIGLIIAMLIVVFYAWTGGMSGYLLP